MDILSFHLIVKTPKRNIQIINEADLEVVLISRESHNNVLTEDVDKINLKDAEMNHNVFLNDSVEEQLAYILYTSGSTGTPKGSPNSIFELTSIY